MPWIPIEELIRNKFKIKPLTVEEGGTGSTTIETLKQNLNLSSIETLVVEEKSGDSSVYNTTQLKQIHIKGSDGSSIDSILNENGELVIQPGCATSSDYVVAKGQSGNWYYRKWSSGRAECWAKVYCDGITCEKTWGSIYYCETPRVVGPYPFEFAEPPCYSFLSTGQRDFLVLPEATRGGIDTDGDGEIDERSDLYCPEWTFYYFSELKESVSAYVDIFVSGWWKIPEDISY